MKDSEVLRKARELIDSEKESYICYAISHVTKGAYWAYTSDTKQAKSLHAWIYKMLGGSQTYATWACKTTGRWPSPRDARKSRLAWLDWMIAYCEKEEAAQSIAKRV
jgi:hypothetical protein